MLISFLQNLEAAILSNPWLFVIFFYVLKIFVKFLVSRIHISEVMTLSYEFGPDFCFMGFTIVAADAVDLASFFQSNFANPFVIPTFILFAMIVAFGLSFYFYRLQREVRDAIDQLRDVIFIRWQVRGRWRRTYQYFLLLISFLIGIGSFFAAIRLTYQIV